MHVLNSFFCFDILMIKSFRKAYVNILTNHSACKC